MHAIYLIANAANGKAYVGSAMSVSRRFIEHKRDLKRGTHANRKLQNAWNKYGKDSFTFSVIEEVNSPTDLLIREQFWIDSLRVVKTGYNIAPTAGSLLGMKHSTETRKRMSLAKLGRKNSPEHVENTRKALTGRTMTDEQKKKMSEAKLGKKRGTYSDETKAKMSAAKKGRPFSEAHKASLSAAAKHRKKRIGLLNTAQSSIH